MPFARNAELPANVRSSLPPGAQTVWRGAFNSANETRSESSSIRIAWTAVRRAGYEPPASGSGQWVKKARDDAPNLRIVSRFASRRCGTCAHYQGFCDLFDFRPSPRELCDDFVPRARARPSNDSFKLELRGEITKLEPERQMVFGWGYVSRRADGSQVVDHSGEVVKIETIEDAAYDYCLHARDMKQMHKGEVRGSLIEIFVSTPEKRAAMGIAEGQIPDGVWLGFKIHDEQAWADVKSGKTRMFSLGGRARRREL